MFSLCAGACSGVTLGAEADPKIIHLRAFGAPSGWGVGPTAEGEREVMAAFRQRYSWIYPENTTGLTLPGGRTMDMVPFMQIAGDIAPEVMYVNFRQSHTYITMKLLYPLDDYIEQVAQVTIADSSALENHTYLTRMKEGDGWEDIDRRVPVQCWEVMRRQCPYYSECPYREAKDLPPLQTHYHSWAYPIGPLVKAMQYDRTLLAEHAHAGVELRTPHDWDELIEWAKIMTNPSANTYGLRVATTAPGYTFANFLYSAGGNVVEQDEEGNWYCVMDSEEAVEAAYFWARLRFERIERGGRVTRGVIKASEEGATTEPTRYAFRFTYLDDRFFEGATDQTQGVGAVPAGPTGLRRSEFNSRMLGIFVGLADDDRRRDAAWSYMQFFDGDEARRIRTAKMVEAGLGPYVRRELLERFNEGGRYDSVIGRIPPGLEETYTTSFAGGVPEPYGKNCQYVYDELAKPLGAIWSSGTIMAAIDRGDEEAAKAEIRGILKRANERINQKMLGILLPEEQARRANVAWAVLAAIMAIFALVMRTVLRAFRPPELREPAGVSTQPGVFGWFKNVGSIFRGVGGPQSDTALVTTPGKAQPAISSASASVSGWRKSRYFKAWLLMAPALMLIALWMYWPVLQGTVIAFQDYNVLGDSTWVGAENFATVLYSEEFWYSMRVSLLYAFLFFLFGFWTPIGLALLLSEVPRGKVFFRTLYYMPAVLSGVVVIFLWKSFYGPSGMINQVLNGFVAAWNYVALTFLPSTAMSYFNEDWLQNPHFALFFCLLPTVWAGMGPGCLIYLAALKTVPDELYEAADIDGAGIRHKLFGVALPTIKILIMINCIGAMIGAVRGAGGFVLAMTGGGPYGETGGATEVIGLKIFYTTFGYLQFGVGASMAWVLGAMLIGFTVMMLKRMSNLEFRTAEKA